MFLLSTVYMMDTYESVHCDRGMASRETESGYYNNVDGGSHQGLGNKCCLD